MLARTMRSSIQTLTANRVVTRLGVDRSGCGLCCASSARGRNVHVQAASADVITTQELSVETDKPKPLTAQAFADDAPARKLPNNFAPETAFTVDSPADADAELFALHPSVGYWQFVETRFSSWNNPSASDPSAPPAVDPPSAMTQLLTSAVTSGDAEAAAYWAYHFVRTGFFTAAAATGAVTHHLAHQAQGLLQSLGFSGGGSSSSSATSAERKSTPFENLSKNAQAELVNRWQEALAVYRRDLQYIQEGSYKLPWDMAAFPAHKQYNPLYAARMTASFCAEAVATLNRRLTVAPADNWFSSNMYPSYYADNTFHYQSDGWFSNRSAEVYEFSTETLFFGRQDAMQRTTLLPLSEYIRLQGLDPAAMTLAEVGCGTGRFHTFIKDNFPTMKTIASDLSPFYLAKARDNINYWKSQRAANIDLGGAESAGTTYIQAPMESLPLPDSSLDVVVCVYCFHEMPESARLAAAKEWFRVLKPGGLVVLTDSVQLGDRRAWDKTLGNFGNMNEPHYRNYIACNIGALFSASGFTCGTKYMSSATKTWSFIKPDTPDVADSAGSDQQAAAREELMEQAPAAAAPVDSTAGGATWQSQSGRPELN